MDVHASHVRSVLVLPLESRPQEDFRPLHRQKLNEKNDSMLRILIVYHLERVRIWDTNLGPGRSLPEPIYGRLHFPSRIEEKSSQTGETHSRDNSGCQMTKTFHVQRHSTQHTAYSTQHTARGARQTEQGAKIGQQALWSHDAGDDTLVTRCRRTLRPACASWWTGQAAPSRR